MKNWLATAISGLIVSLSMVASAEPTGLALCELLTKTPRYDEENSERVETKGLSFLVPRGMKRRNWRVLIRKATVGNKMNSKSAMAAVTRGQLLASN